MSFYPSFEEFVRTWQANNSIVGVSRELKRMGYLLMDGREVKFWAKNLRKKGVKLKRMGVVLVQFDSKGGVQLIPV